MAGAVPGTRSPRMFVLFSNRLGCRGSLLVTLIGTAILLLNLGVIDLS